jgi:uncharacterized membrane protein YkoI
MNATNLGNNRKLLAVILIVAIGATVGGSLAYAQTTGTPGTNSQSNTAPKIQGSINLQQNIMSNVKTSFSTAQDTAASAVTNGKVIGGSLTVIQGSVVYDFKVIDDKNLAYSVIVDAGNGKVLYTSQGQSSNFGGFGMGGHCSKGGHAGWNPQQTPSSTTSQSTGNTSPSSVQTNTLTGSQT